MDNFREWLSDNLRYILLGLAIILVLGISILIVRLVGGIGKENGGNGKTPISITETDGETEKTSGDGTEPTGGSESESETETETEAEALVENDANILALVQQYYTAIANKDIDLYSTLVENATEEAKQTILDETAIESYHNIAVYSKNGPEDASYVVYIYYEAKIAGVEPLVPSMSSLYVKTREDGSLYAADPNENADVKAAIEQMKSDTDVQKLITSVQKKYNEVLNASEELQSVMKQMGQAETEINIPDADSTGVEANKVVWALDVVYVRSDSTTTAEEIGMLDVGASVTRIRELDNGWSEVRYGDAIGYIKSEFLTENQDEVPLPTTEG
ncbi:MAG: SH3 domain-containing protein [Candidatus Limivivens sp.]|nr:SH3 domain-containing protein [Candidatus Limivivens sp.]